MDVLRVHDYAYVKGLEETCAALPDPETTDQIARRLMDWGAPEPIKSNTNCFLRKGCARKKKVSKNSPQKIEILHLKCNRRSAVYL